MKNKTLMALSIVVFLGITNISSQGSTYIAHQLSIPAAYNHTEEIDINDSGQITGIFDNLESGIIWNDYNSEPQIISQNNARLSSRLINNSGLIAGHILNQEDNIFTWSKSSDFKEINTPTGTSLTLSAMNDMGTIVGFADVGNIEELSDMKTVAYCLSSSGKFDYLDGITDNDKFSCANDINNSGDIVGCASTANGRTRACLWHEGEATIDLGAFSGTWSEALSINNKGQVLGIYGVDDGNLNDGGYFIWSKDSAPIILPTLLTKYSSDSDWRFSAIAINDNGVVLGCGGVNNGNDSNVMTWSEKDGFNVVGKGVPYAINNSGYIVGSDRYLGTPLLWQPVPEPSSILALFCGLGSLSAFKILKHK